MLEIATVNSEMISNYFKGKMDRIVGGQAAKSNSWPWIAHLMFQSQGQIDSSANVSGMFYSQCAGTIIDNRWILTAGHCCDGRVKVTIAFGQHDKDQNDPGEFQ